MPCSGGSSSRSPRVAASGIRFCFKSKKRRSMVPVPRPYSPVLHPFSVGWETKRARVVKVVALRQTITSEILQRDPSPSAVSIYTFLFHKKNVSLSTHISICQVDLQITVKKTGLVFKSSPIHRQSQFFFRVSNSSWFLRRKASENG